MWVKICANTCVEDALKAVELGADAVGFVFAPSRRQVTPAQVKQISMKLPQGVERVGVFGAGSVEEITQAIETADLTAVQMHGGVDLAFARRLGARVGPEVSIIKTVHWAVGEDVDSANKVEAQLKAVAEEGNGYRVLVDAQVGPSVSGGTGKNFNWESAQAAFQSQPELRLIVAGGLRPDNVAEAIRILQPWGVDVASGVEREPGRKDFAKLKSFIKNARGAV